MVCSGVEGTVEWTKLGSDELGRADWGRRRLREVSRAQKFVAWQPPTLASIRTLRSIILLSPSLAPYPVASHAPPALTALAEASRRTRGTSRSGTRLLRRARCG